MPGRQGAKILPDCCSGSVDLSCIVPVVFVTCLTGAASEFCRGNEVEFVLAQMADFAPAGLCFSGCSNKQSLTFTCANGV